jgi:hypothetical protein
MGQECSGVADVAVLVLTLPSSASSASSASASSLAKASRGAAVEDGDGPVVGSPTRRGEQTEVVPALRAARRHMDTGLGLTERDRPSHGCQRGRALHAVQQLLDGDLTGLVVTEQRTVGPRGCGGA